MKHVLKSLVALFFLIAITRLSFSAPKNPSDDIKVVHGRDGRIDTFHLAGTVWEELSRSVAMQIKNSDMISNDEVSTKLLGLSLSKSLEPALCADEQFATQIKVGSCSGFLVSDSHIVTAGHCLLSQADCDNKSWVFDYELKYAEDLDYTVVPSRNIFKCKKITLDKWEATGVTDSTFSISIINAKIIPQTSNIDSSVILFKSLGKSISKSLKDNNRYNSFQIVFVVTDTAFGQIQQLNKAKTIFPDFSACFALPFLPVFHLSFVFFLREIQII